MKCVTKGISSYHIIIPKKIELLHLINYFNCRLQQQLMHYQNEAMTLPILEERRKTLRELLQTLRNEIKQTMAKEAPLKEKLSNQITIKQSKKADHERTLTIMQSNISVNNTFEWDMAK